MSKAKKKQNNKSKASDANKEAFVWSDDEVELLLSVTNDYKVSKAMADTDRESCQSKYTDILQLFKERYPSSKEEAVKLGKDYPHNPDDLTKATITTKLKAIRVKYRQAVDSGRKSGHGRVVLLYFEHCERIWGGSPATDTLQSGIETNEIFEMQSDSIQPSISCSPSLLEATNADSPSNEQCLHSNDEEAEGSLPSPATPSPTSESYRSAPSPSSSTSSSSVSEC